MKLHEFSECTDFDNHGQAKMTIDLDQVAVIHQHHLPGYSHLTGIALKNSNLAYWVDMPYEKVKELL